MVRNERSRLNEKRNRTKKKKEENCILALITHSIVPHTAESLIPNAVLIPLCNNTQCTHRSSVVRRESNTGNALCAPTR